MSRIPSREEALFVDALAQPPAQRGAYLELACVDDAALRARVAALLTAHDGGESLLVSSAPSRPASAAADRPGDRIGRYKLLHKIGEGSCSIVWMAEQEEPVRRRVALKVITLGIDAKTVIARFEAGRQTFAILESPNIAQVYEAGETGRGRPYFATELVRGMPITKYCDRNRLTATQRLELFLMVCGAIRQAHETGIIHRDLKPSNILVVFNDGRVTPKVLEFGLAAAMPEWFTDARLHPALPPLVCSPVYLSPEQLETSCLDIDARSDIYSLGVLLYELLIGHAPSGSKPRAQLAAEEIQRQIREAEPHTPSQRLQALDRVERATVSRLRCTTPARLACLLRRDLDWIVMRCLERERTRRYHAVDQLAADIRRHLRNEPLVAQPPGAADPRQNLIRRNGTGFAAGVATLGTLIAGTIARTWRGLRATGAEPSRAKRSSRHGGFWSHR